MTLTEVVQELKSLESDYGVGELQVFIKDELFSLSMMTVHIASIDRTDDKIVINP